MLLFLAKLKLDFIEIIYKTQETEQQKMMNNSFHQCQNLDGVFELTEKPSHEAVLLIDDVVDSRWTTTVISALLRSKGSGKVFPFALANYFGG